MRVTLKGLIAEAHGPFGGSDRLNKLVQAPDGTQVMQARKHTVTGPSTKPLHAWNKMQWVLVDQYWKTLPQPVRAEWGKCTKRSPTRHRSNLDEFRAVNLPRMILGMPPIRLPPKRGPSRRQRLLNSPGSRNSHMTVWVEGEQKPEPPGPGEPAPPPDAPGQPFDRAHGDLPHPLVASVACWQTPCLENILRHSNDVYLFGVGEFPARTTDSFLRWVGSTDLAGTPAILQAQTGGDWVTWEGYTRTLGPGTYELGGTKALPAGYIWGPYLMLFAPHEGNPLPTIKVWSYPRNRYLDIRKTTLGAKIFADRSYTFGALSFHALPCWHALVYSADRNNTSEAQHRIELDGPAKVWIAWDMRQGPLPWWLFSWSTHHYEPGAARTLPWKCNSRLLSVQSYPGLPARAYIDASDLTCTTDPIHGHPLPWESAWWFRLVYNCPPEAVLSHAYYWSPGSPLPPHGAFDLFEVDSPVGSYEWPDSLVLDPAGPYLEEAPCCYPAGSLVDPNMHPASIWFDREDPESWAGLNWAVPDFQGVAPDPAKSWGTAYSSHTEIRCCTEGERAGLWWFRLTVLHGGQPFVLEYRKPAGYDTFPIFGHYLLHDPASATPWAMRAMAVWDQEIDWNKHNPNRAEAILWQIAEILIIELAFHVGRPIVKHWLVNNIPGLGYSDDALRAMAREGYPAWEHAVSMDMHCRASWRLASAKPYKEVGDPLINELMRRLRAAKHLPPLPPWMVPP